MSEKSEEKRNQINDLCKKWTTQLQNQERMVRQNTLKEMLIHFESDQVNKENIQAYYDEIYIHLLKAYTDRFEICRSLAASIVSAAVKHLPRNSAYLEYICTILAQRLAQAEILEESEELRLQLVQQIHDLVKKFKQDDSREDLILKAYNDIIDILIKTTKDPYPAIQKESCEVVKLLAVATPSFRYRAEVLTKPITIMLQHRFSANRAVAIETLSIIALHILSNDDKVGNIIMDLSKSLMDDVPMVRRECGRAGILLGIELRDRYSHFSKILPLILCCLVDETEEVRQEIAAGWIRVGAQYFDENAEQLKELELTDTVPENYPTDIRRPKLGCRALVQRNLKMVNIILHEMEDWKEDVRLHSTKLLGQVVIHSEKLFATQFIDTYPVLAKTCVDSERIVAAEAMLIALYLGTFLNYSCWGDYVRKQMQKRPYLGNLKCYSALFTSAPTTDKLKDLPEISETLVDTAICQNTAPEYQLLLLQFVDVLADGLLYTKTSESLETPELCATEQNLYTIVTKVLALSDKNEDVESLGREILTKLASYSYASVSSMHQRYIVHLLNQIEGLEIETNEVTEIIYLLSGIIRTCGINLSNIDIFKPKLVTALKNTCPEGRIMIFTSIAEAMLKCVGDGADDEKEAKQITQAAIQKFALDVICPYLTWNAGKSAESVRTMASACLCATVQGAGKTTGELLINELTDQIVPLIEDNSIRTRAYAIRTLLSAGPLKLPKFKSIIFQILARLDDTSSEVRELSAKSLGILKVSLEESETKDCENVLSQVLERMILHLESPEQNLRELLIASIKSIGKDFPEIFQQQIDAMPEHYPMKKLLLEVPDETKL